MFPALGEHASYSFRIANDVQSAIRQLHWACRSLVILAEGEPSDDTYAFHRVGALIHGICEALAKCEHAGVSPEDIRTVIGPARAVHARSPFVRRLQDWPRGYPGDFETIEWLWRAENHAAPGTFAHALERYALTSTIAQQHRNKVVFQAACVLEALERHPQARILSLACGSSPDVRTISGHVKPGARFVMCDSDPDALAFSAGRLTAIADRCRFVHGMVPRVLRQVRDDGPYHLIFAGGLFDYLSDRLVALSLGAAWRTLLAPGGRIVFTNIARGNPFRVWLENLAEWQLIERAESDVERICREAGISAPVTLDRESTGLALLASVRKD